MFVGCNYTMNESIRKYLSPDTRREGPGTVNMRTHVQTMFGCARLCRSLLFTSSIIYDQQSAT